MRSDVSVNAKRRMMERLLNKLEMINFDEIELDEILDQREIPVFDREWNRVYRRVEELKKGTVIHESKKIQKRVFISVYGRTMSDEIAS